mmetsp:Transcript_33051/g.78394  ORF Transcript_33051/g.78394 Transcript_33051/m.78394 type:complete len:132 (-) Transcript_33051:111-506(-)
MPSRGEPQFHFHATRVLQHCLRRGELLQTCWATRRIGTAELLTADRAGGTAGLTRRPGLPPSRQWDLGSDMHRSAQLHPPRGPRRATADLGRRHDSAAAPSMVSGTAVENCGTAAYATHLKKGREGVRGVD